MLVEENKMNCLGDPAETSMILCYESLEKPDWCDTMQNKLQSRHSTVLPFLNIQQGCNKKTQLLWQF